MEGSSAESSLMERAARGDASARRQLVVAYQGVVFRLLKRQCGDDAHAEDVTQETFITALEKLPTWRGEGTPKGWLLAIARTKCLMSRRGAASRHEPSEDASLEQLGLEAGWGAAMDPEALAARLQEQQVMERALASLSPEDREVVTLRDLEGLSGEETAEVLGLGLAAMKSRLHRARLALVAAVKKGAGAHG